MMKARTKWLLAIGGLLGANLLAMIALAASAQHDRAQVIPGYYEAAIRYDERIDEAAWSKTLGWTSTAHLDRGALDVALRDATGAMIFDARVHVRGHQRAHAADGFDLELASDGRGHYRGVTTSTWTGLHDLTIIVERGGDRFVDRVTVEAR